MNSKIRKFLTASKELSAHERALLAHCLISSLDASPDEDVESAWLKVAEQRLQEYESGRVQPVDWQDIKSKLGG